MCRRVQKAFQYLFNTKKAILLRNVHESSTGHFLFANNHKTGLKGKSPTKENEASLKGKCWPLGWFSERLLEKPEPELRILSIHC